MDVEPHEPGQPSSQGGGHGRPSDHWSGRARRLIERCQTMSAEWLKQPVRACLDELERQLFALSESARDPFDQQRHFNVRQRVLAERGALEARFLARIGEAFQQLGASTGPTATDEPKLLQLSLVDTTEHEMTVALDKLASRGEARGGGALYELGYRLAVLVAAPPLEGGAVPVGPLTLARALRSAAAAIELPVEHDLLLLRCLETALLPELSGFYGALNAMLEKEGILPLLRPYPLVRPAVPQARAGGAAGVGGATSAAAPASAAAAAGPGAAVGSSAEHAHADEPIAVLDSLRELLARRRRSPAAYGGEPVEAATPEELQTALSALQKHLSLVADKATRELRSAQLLREELLTQLNADKPSGAPRTGLTAEQGDTVELVSMLFEQLSQQTEHSEGTHALLGGLQLPVLRMAVSDRNFFDQKEHPARQLLGTVTEVANDWLDDSGSDADRHLRAKLEQLVERANREPPSAGLYTTLLADIQQHLTLLTRKAQATERRHIEAMQGRERLDQARQRATKLIGERFAHDPPRGLLRALLDRAWSDVLALTILRHGEDSDAVAAQLLITDQLLGRKPVADRLQLQTDVEAGLQQIGMHHEEAIQVAHRLVNPGDAPAPMAGGETLSTTDLALRLKQHQRLGEHQQPAPPAAVPTAPPVVEEASEEPLAKKGRERKESPTRPPARREPVVDPREIETQERLRLLPFGRWFEFTDRKSGKTSQRKLAWFSPVSGQTLFVNRRGIRTDDISLPQLAHEMVKGRVRELGEMKESLLDRAWHSLTGNLLRTPNGRPGRPAY